MRRLGGRTAQNLGAAASWPCAGTDVRERELLEGADRVPEDRSIPQDRHVVHCGGRGAFFEMTRTKPWVKREGAVLRRLESQSGCGQEVGELGG